jgi:heme-degrading monooxygenase HmoA
MNLEGKIRSLLVLEPRNGDYGALIAMFRERDVLGKAVKLAGAWSAEVHVPLSRSGPVVVTAVWDSAEAYEGWRNHPIRAEMSPFMERIVDLEATPVITSGVYEVVISASRARLRP